MPTYQYRNRETGDLEERVLPVARRDCVPAHLERITVPVRVVTRAGPGLPDPVSAVAAVPKAFREYELSGASPRQIERETGFSREHIRRVWDF